MGPDPRRSLPSIDSLLATPAAAEWAAAYGRETVKAALRGVLEAVRRDPTSFPSDDPEKRLLELAGRTLEARARPSLTPVRNGTGVVLHTNLGRARLAPEAIDAVRRASGYGNVEFSLDTGERGSRYDHCTAVLSELTGAAAALITNNNAAAVSLCVNELAAGREVVVSRGELVEIGGSFRIPDVVSRSGGTLREVGTTNRTRPGDYEGAVGADTGMVLRVHPANYRVEGFASRPEVGEVARVASAAGVPFVHDVGSGLLREELLPGFPDEPTVAASLAAGADLVTFSGDKLLGGPQAGLIVGREDLIARLRRNPLLRAFRVDKTTLAALEATLMLYRDAELAAERVPTLRMLLESAADVRVRAAGASKALDGSDALSDRVEVVPTRAVVGGGSFPGHEIDSAGWLIPASVASPDAVAAACRRLMPPLIGRIRDGGFIVDVRTIEPGDERAALEALVTAVGRARESSRGPEGA